MSQLMKASQLLAELLKGKYLRKSTDFHGTSCYKLYSGNMNPEYKLSDRLINSKHIKPLLKQDNKGNYTLNLNEVRRLHGNFQIKKIYKLKRAKP